MKEERSASQILFGFLPHQTVDVSNRVWRVLDEWQAARVVEVDQELLRAELLRAIQPWTAAAKDGGIANHLRQQREFRIYALNRQLGVSVEPFPDTWRCRSCDRVFTGRPDRCICGADHLGQLPFVGFHECGRIREPWYRTCPTHRQVRMRNGDSSSFQDVSFSCPICNARLTSAFVPVPCECGSGNVQYNVHRASNVYTPRTIVVANPPSPEQVRQIRDAGGGARALTWVLGGLREQRFDAVAASYDAIVENLMRQFQIDRPTAESMASVARAAGQTEERGGGAGLDAAARGRAEAAALRVVLGLSRGRRRISEMRAALADGWGERGTLYGVQYPAAVRAAGLEDVELVVGFPVLTANYAYNRGGAAPGTGTLIPFRRRGFRGLVGYGEIAETEALFVRLSPLVVAQWLRARGHALPVTNDSRAARTEILRLAEVPSVGDPGSGNPLGADVLSLVHSFAHRFLRRAAAFAGIDRNALSEFVIPEHLAFFVYASARGDFVLGGLEAVFESELHLLLADVARAETRCALDPGCARGGGACVACLHVGEPSCRFFNQFLDRLTLAGEPGAAGFLALARDAAAS